MLVRTTKNKTKEKKRKAFFHVGHLFQEVFSVEIMPQPWPPPSIMPLGLALPALPGPGQDGFQVEFARRHQADAEAQEKEDHA